MLSGPNWFPEADPEAGIVFLHGYGADGNDLITLAPLLVERLGLPAACFAPNAPQTTAFGIGRQWFSDAGGTFLDMPGIDLATDSLYEYLEEEVWNHEGIVPEKTILFGFSMGTMLALHAAPRLEQTIGGVVGCSGRLVFGDALEALENPNRMPILLAHGKDDDVVPYDDTERAAMVLEGCGYKVTTKLYDNLPHAIDMRVVEDACQFMRKIIA